MGWLGWSGVLLFVNAAITQGPPWFLIPSGLMFIDVLKRGGSIWSDGIGPFEAFKKGIRAKLRAERGIVDAAEGNGVPAAARAAADAGANGRVARAARRDRRAVR